MSSSPSPQAAGQPPSQPWWKYGHVWLIITGPAIVVVAGFFTLWLAMSRPDPVVAEDYYQRGLDINKTLQEEGGAAAGTQQAAGMEPAIKGRNHAATPAEHKPR